MELTVRALPTPYPGVPDPIWVIQKGLPQVTRFGELKRPSTDGSKVKSLEDEDWKMGDGEEGPLSSTTPITFRV
jgi:hypothetical protein